MPWSAGPAAVLRRPRARRPAGPSVGRNGRHRVEDTRADVVDAAAEHQARVVQHQVDGDQAGARPDAPPHEGAVAGPPFEHEHAPRHAQGEHRAEQAPAGPVGRRRVAQVVEVQECAAEERACPGQPSRRLLPQDPRHSRQAGHGGQDRHVAEDNEHGAPWLVGEQRERSAAGSVPERERPERANDGIRRRGGDDRGDGAGQVGRQVDAECQDAVDRRPGAAGQDGAVGRSGHQQGGQDPGSDASEMSQQVVRARVQRQRPREDRAGEERDRKGAHDRRRRLEPSRQPAHGQRGDDAGPDEQGVDPHQQAQAQHEAGQRPARPGLRHIQEREPGGAHEQQADLGDGHPHELKHER